MVSYPVRANPFGLYFSSYLFIKAGVHLKAVFTPLLIGLMEISRSRFKQYKPYAQNTNQCFGVFCKFFGDF